MMMMRQRILAAFAMLLSTMMLFDDSSSVVVSAFTQQPAMATMTTRRPFLERSRDEKSPFSLSATATRRQEDDEQSSSQSSSIAPNRRQFVQQQVSSALLLTFFSNIQPARAAYIDAQTDLPEITQRVYLDVAIAGKDVGRLEVGLFGKLAPRAASNFYDLCQANAYAGTTFYRVLSGYNVQAGELSSDKAPPMLEPDNFDLKHNKAGLVSYVRATPSGGADSRFFINTQDDAGWADDRYAAFGIVLGNGLEEIVKKKIETVKVQTPKNKPLVDVVIVQSGVL